ncbi:Pleckstrin [Trichinella spiralis]|uniref:Pleckstrin n=1 Tax=Trichinella spiralis TaxID=6334 RepID=A0ABR3KZ02_TRISP
MRVKKKPVSGRAMMKLSEVTDKQWNIAGWMQFGDARYLQKKELAENFPIALRVRTCSADTRIDLLQTVTKCSSHQIYDRKMMNQIDIGKLGIPTVSTALNSGGPFSSKIHSWGKRSRSCNARQAINSIHEDSDTLCSGQNSFVVKISLEDNKSTMQENSDTNDGIVETVTAVKGVTLKDALVGVVKKYHLNMDQIHVFLKSSNTPLPLETDSSFLGGLKVFLRNKEDDSPFSKNPMYYSNKSNVSMAGSSSSSNSAKLDVAMNGKPERKLSLGTISKRKSEKLALINEPGGHVERTDNMLNSTDATLLLTASMAPGTDSISGRKERSRSHGRLSQIFPNPFKVVDRAEILDNLIELQEEGLHTAASLLQDPSIPSSHKILALEDRWQDIVKNNEDLNRKQQKQQEGLWELISTELDYICKLGSIVELQSCVVSLQQEGIGHDIEVDSVFGNIGEICRANLGFWVHCVLPLLQFTRQTGEPLDPTKMELGFQKFDQLFRPYIPYCLSHVDILCYIRQKLKESDFFRDLIVWIQSRKAFGRLHLTDLLAKPMQRLTKYPLLLKAVLHNTIDSSSKASLTNMIEKAEEFASRVNIELCFKQHYDALCSIMQCIDSYEAIDSANDELEKFVKEFSVVDLTLPMPDCRPGLLRRQLMRGELRMRESYTKTDVTCILFTDMLLVCKQTARKGDRPRVKIIRPPYDVENVVVKKLRESNGFMFLYLNKFRVAAYACVFHTSSLEDTYRWLEAFHTAKEEYGYLRTIDHAGYGFPPNLKPSAEKMAETVRMIPAEMKPLNDASYTSSSYRGSLAKRIAAARQDRIIPCRRTSMGAVDCRTSGPASAMDVSHRKCNSMDTTTLPSNECRTEQARRKLSDKGIKLAEQLPSELFSPYAASAAIDNVNNRLYEAVEPAVDTDQLKHCYPSTKLEPTKADAAGPRSPFNLPNFFPVQRMFPVDVAHHGKSKRDDTIINPTYHHQQDESLSWMQQISELGNFSLSSRRLERRYHTADGIEVLKPKSMPTANILKRFSWSTAAGTSGLARARQSGASHTTCRKASSSTASSESCCSSSGISSSSSHLQASQSENELLLEAPLQAFRDVIKSRKLSFAPPSGATDVDNLLQDPTKINRHISSVFVGDATAEQTQQPASPSTASTSSSCTICPTRFDKANRETDNEDEAERDYASDEHTATTKASHTSSSTDESSAPTASLRRRGRPREDLFKIILEAQLESSNV